MSRYLAMPCCLCKAPLCCVYLIFCILGLLDSCDLKNYEDGWFLISNLVFTLIFKMKPFPNCWTISWAEGNVHLLCLMLHRLFCPPTLQRVPSQFQTSNMVRPSSAHIPMWKVASSGFPGPQEMLLCWETQREAPKGPVPCILGSSLWPLSRPFPFLQVGLPLGMPGHFKGCCRKQNFGASLV